MQVATCSMDIYLPIEITRREYSGHLLLATEMASRGYTVVIGTKRGVSELMKTAKRKGLLFYKNGRVPKMVGPHAAMVGMDPEAGISYGRFADFLEWRPSLQNLAATTAQFAYGLDDYECLSERATPQGRVHMTGSPRVELWGSAGDEFYRADIMRIRRRYGQFVLFASSGGFEHPNNVRRGWVSSEQVLAASNAAGRFLEFIAAAAVHLQCAIVVRPHPSDSWSEWRHRTRQLNNVFVDSSLDLSAWARSASAVVHPGTSTAAIESVVARVPAISVGTNSSSKDTNVDVPRTLSYQVESLSDFIPLLISALQGDLRHRLNDATEKLLHRKLMQPLEGATSRLADAIEGTVRFDARSGLSGTKRYYSALGLPFDRRGRPSLAVQKEPAFKLEVVSRRRLRDDVEGALRVLGKKPKSIEFEAHPYNSYVLRGR